MPVYSKVGDKLKKLSIISLDKEKALQTLIENNLSEILDMEFLASEYNTTHGGRIDTLAIDLKGAPVIIEYKRNRNDTVIPQALFYLNWLKSQKSEFFELLVMKRLGEERAKQIDWKNPRVVCIAESYNPYDIIALNEIPNLELYRYLYYENDLFTLENVKGEEEKPKKTEKTIVSTPIDKVIASDSQPDLEAHLLKGNEFVRNLFYIIQEKILLLDENIDIKINNNYIAFKVSKIFAEVHIQKNKILLYLRPVEFVDPENRIEKIPDTYNWSLNQRIYINNEADIDYVMPLIEQSYRDVL